MATLLQIDFPLEGPWGDEMASAFSGLAEVIAQAPGLRWKIWTENPDEGLSGGIYLFDDDASAQAYLTEHTARLASFGITDLRAVMFQINEPLTAINHGPLTAA